jgi:hypothetical protein
MRCPRTWRRRRSAAVALALLPACGGSGDDGGAAVDGGDVRAAAGAPAPARWACEADLAILGIVPNDHLGFALGGLGPDGRADWNGDGAPDLLIGANQKLDVPAPGDRPPGSITLVLSPWTWKTPIVGPRDRAFLRVAGEAGSRLGRSVAWIGDLDGDGRSDFCAGDVRGPSADGAWTQRGVVHVFLSGDAGTGLAGALESGLFRAADASVVVAGEGAGHRFGHALAGAGDVDGDGTPDVLVGAPGCLATGAFGGRAYLLSGARLLAAAREAGGAPLPAGGLALWSVEGGEPHDALGYDVARVGAGAFAVGAAQMTLDPALGLSPERSLATYGPGFVVLVDQDPGGAPGALRERRLAGGSKGETFGAALGAADVDGDGLPELLVGAPGWNGPAGPRAGRAVAFALADLSARAEVRGEAPLQMTGWSVAGYGRAAGSGSELWAVGDFGFTRPPAAGAPPCPGAIADGPVPGAGRMRVFAGLETDTPRFAVVGDRNGDSAGAIFAHLGDLDGAGGTDVVLSVFRWDEPAPRNDVGKICVFRDAL